MEVEEEGTREKPIPLTLVHPEQSQRAAQRRDYACTQKRTEGALERGKPQTNLVHVSHEKLLTSEEVDGQDLKPAKEMLPLETRLPIKDNQDNSVHFLNDQQHTVDFVLVWDHENSAAIEVEAYEKRKVFEANLTKEGLKLQQDDSLDNGLVFIKIHAPQSVLRCYAEILKFQMPMKEMPALACQATVKTGSFFKKVRSIKDGVLSRVYVDEKVFPPRGQRYTTIFSRDKEYLFDINSPSFFPPAIRSQIVQFIIDRKRFSVKEEDESAFGMKRLIANGVYSGAYPLHDGDIDTPGSMRHLLHQEWAALRKILRYQPLDYVKDYFGVNVALYFAWLGFYTYMLIPAAIVGLLCFAYSWSTINSNPTSQDFCDRPDMKYCHLCDAVCVYWSREEKCVHERVTYFFDNGTMVLLAVFMSFWAAIFLELWKRYSAEITHRWDLTCFDSQEEYPRPQYLVRLAHVKKTRVNVGTNQVEPRVSFWSRKLPATMFSYSVFVLLIVVSFVALSGVLLYEACFRAAVKIPLGNYSVEIKDIITVAIAALINFAGIMLFKWIYPWVAEKLTEFEFLRTQTEFDESLSLKIYILQFVNYYASCFYIAFFKGTSFGYFTPDQHQRHDRAISSHELHEEETSIHGQLIVFRGECGPTGCLTELSIQLAIIMIGKQTLTTFLEMVLPLLYKLYNTLKMKLGRAMPMPSSSPLQWMQDYTLVVWGPRQLFTEYLEMVLQYGFVTLFVAAFPLAPFFALVNNVLEMRLDAKKLITFHRRPVAQRVRDIGVWYRILDSIGKLAVITNGCIIAFTSDYIPRFVYKFMVSKSNSFGEMWRYSDDEHPWVDLERLDPFFLHLGNVTCPYSDAQKTDWAIRKYTTTMFWIVLAARLAFIVIFENVVAFVIIVVRWCIPEMPKRIRDQIRSETDAIKDVIIKEETARVLNRTFPPSGPSSGPSSGPDMTLREDAINLTVPATGNRGSPRDGGGEIALRTKTSRGDKLRFHP